MHFIGHSQEQKHSFGPRPPGGGGAVRVYISVIQKLSFLSPPTTHSGSVRCQLRPDPTAADPTVTGWKDSGM